MWHTRPSTSTATTTATTTTAAAVNNTKRISYATMTRSGVGGGGVDLLPEDLLPVVVGWLDGSICHGFRCSGSDQVQPAEEVEDRVVDDQRRSAGGRSGRRRRRRRRRRRAVPPQRSQRPPAPLKKKERNDELYRCFIRFSVAFTIGLRIFTRLG